MINSLACDKKNMLKEKTENIENDKYISKNKIKTKKKNMLLI